MPVADVLWELGRGGSEDHIQRYSRSALAELSREDIRAAAGHGATLARERTLSPPAAGWFARDKHLLGEHTLEEVQEHAITVLDRMAQGVSEEQILTQHPDFSQPLVRAAAYYGAALALDERLPPASPETPRERFLRDLLSPEDRKLIEAFYIYHRGAQSPEKMLSRWERLVEQVEEGYRNMWEEYVNDLGYRDVLEDTLSMVSPSSQDQLRETIRPWDRRFEDATRWSSKSILPGRYWQPQRWWYYRMPKRLGAGMERSDLDSFEIGHLRSADQ